LSGYELINGSNEILKVEPIDVCLTEDNAMAYKENSNLIKLKEYKMCKTEADSYHTDSINKIGISNEMTETKTKYIINFI
jgi:hypothetical protein